MRALPASLALLFTAFGSLPLPGQEAAPLVLTFAGDLMAHSGNQRMRDYNDIYRALSPWLLTDDLSFINLETPIDTASPISDYPRFNATPAYLEAAVRGGFDVFSLANNHSNDLGPPGTEGTLSTVLALKKRFPLVWSGLKKSDTDPLEPVVIQHRGWKIGFIALTNLVNQGWGRGRVNLVSLWDVWTGKVLPENQETLLSQIRQWKQEVDLLVVGLHDGVEYTASPSRAQLDLYPRLVQAGVDILWCHHPHVLLPWSWVQTDRGPRLVFYSMGNFVSRQTSLLGPSDGAGQEARKGDGALIQVSLGRPGPSGDVAVAKVEAIPLNNYLDPKRGTLVLPTETLVAEAPGAWKDYYRRRLEVQQRWAIPLQEASILP